MKSLFNINDYNNDGKYVMRCKTEEEANIFLEYLDSLGLKWRGGRSYLDKNNWREYREDTCYNFASGTYGDKDYFVNDGYEILECKNFIFNDGFKNEENDVEFQKFISEFIVGGEC